MKTETLSTSGIFDLKEVCLIYRWIIDGKIIGRNQLFKILRTHKVLQEGNNLPYKKYIDGGYFSIEKKNLSRKNMYQKEYSKTLVSPKGVELITNLIKQIK